MKSSVETNQNIKGTMQSNLILLVEFFWLFCRCFFSGHFQCKGQYEEIYVTFSSPTHPGKLESQYNSSSMQASTEPYGNH